MVIIYLLAYLYLKIVHCTFVNFYHNFKLITYNLFIEKLTSSKLGKQDKILFKIIPHRNKGYLIYSKKN